MTTEQTTIGAGVALIVGALLPWVHQTVFFASETRAGTASILGYIVIGAGGMIIWLRKDRRSVLGFAIVAAVPAGIVLAAVLARADQGYSLGVGLLVTLAASAVAIYISRKAPAVTEDAKP
jgi:hypothetical protein